MTLRVLALASYPEQAAATRFRLSQFGRHLLEHGITLDVRPFLDAGGFARLYSGRRAAVARALLKATAARLADIRRLPSADVVLVQREAALFGPPLFEMLAQRKKPLVLDLDDATWVGYDSPTYGRVARAVKWPGKANSLIDRASVVACGNTFIASYVASRRVPAVLLPTVVDTAVFRPSDDRNEPPVIGWIGTHSTFRYLEAVLPALRAVATRRRFRLLVVGAGDVIVDVPGADVEVRPWRLDREVDDFRSIDIGLYPLVDDGWAAGKSGFKAVQYLSVGVPFVATPLGATTEIGEAGTTHLLANGIDEWEAAVERLVLDADARRHMGAVGRKVAESQYTLEGAAATLAGVLKQAAGAG